MSTEHTEPAGLSDEELLKIAEDSCMDRFEGERRYSDEIAIEEGYWEAWDHQLLHFARAVEAATLARAQRQPVPPEPVSEWQTGLPPSAGFYYVRGLLDESIGGDNRPVYVNPKDFVWGFWELDDPEWIGLDSSEITPENIQWKPVSLMPQPVPVSEWRTIDTAPKDGTEILASDYDAVEILSWRKGRFELGIPGEWISRDGQAFFPAWWQPLADHPALPLPGKVEG